MTINHRENKLNDKKIIFDLIETNSTLKKTKLGIEAFALDLIFFKEFDFKFKNSFSYSNVECYKL